MSLDKNREIRLMAIVNLTGDSYFAGSRCADVEAAMDRIGQMISEGADIIDIGACSTRPGSEPVGADEEWLRLEPVLRAFRERWPDFPLSIDTYWSSVVVRAYDLVGDFIVNDISAGHLDPDMLAAVGRLGLTYVAMHMRGTPLTMQEMTGYKDITAEVLEYFRDFELRASEAGVSSWILDPGFGFAKTAEQNYELLRNLGRLSAAGRPILVGVSRKSMIYKRFDISPEEALPATQVLHLHALDNGADILRVHDVAEAGRTVDMYRLLR